MKAAVTPGGKGSRPRGLRVVSAAKTYFFIMSPQDSWKEVMFLYAFSWSSVYVDRRNTGLLLSPKPFIALPFHLI